MHHYLGKEVILSIAPLRWAYPNPNPRPNPNPYPNQATQTFAVTSTSTTLGSAANPRAELRTQTRVERFDYVVCASGHYSTPNSPHFDGLEDFHGRVRGVGFQVRVRVPG